MAAPFEWDCPTYGCRGLIIMEVEPDLGDRALCRRPTGSSERVCGREMLWEGDGWQPAPFRGFREEE
jgi:hypothetical protein